MADEITGLRLSEPDITLIGKLAVVENLSLAAVATIACLNVLGWLAPQATGLFKAGWRPMSAGAALAALLCVIAFYLCRPRFAANVQRIGSALALLVAAFCGAVLADHLGYVALPSAKETLSWLNRGMTPQAAGTFALMGIAIAMMRARRRMAGIVADFFTFCLLFVVAVLASGHIIGRLQFFGPVSSFATSAQTLVCLLLLALAVFIRRAESGVFSILLGRGIGSKVARILTPVLLVVPYVREGLRAHILDLRHMPPHYITAFLATLAVTISMALLMYLAWRLNALETEIQDLSLRDPLTGLYNLRGFRLLAEQAMLLANRSGESFSVLFVDVDNLKQINDALGHQAGSDYLSATAAILRDAFRETDVLGRIGGDEFAMAGQFTSDGIADAAQRLRHSASERGTDGSRYPLSFSIGCATSSPDQRTTLAGLLARADEEMYEEKRCRKAASGLRHAGLAAEHAPGAPAPHSGGEPAKLEVHN